MSNLIRRSFVFSATFSVIGVMLICADQAFWRSNWGFVALFSLFLALYLTKTPKVAN